MGNPSSPEPANGIPQQREPSASEGVDSLRSALEAFARLQGPELALVLRGHQRNRWRAGERVPVEAFLAAMPALAGQEAIVLELIGHERLLRLGTGEEPKWEEYFERFPHSDFRPAPRSGPTSAL